MSNVLGPGVFPFFLFAVIARRINGRSRSPPDNRESRTRTIECGSTAWNLGGADQLKFAQYPVGASLLANALPAPLLAYEPADAFSEQRLARHRCCVWSQGFKRQPWRSPIQAARLVRPHAADGDALVGDVIVKTAGGQPLLYIAEAILGVVTHHVAA